MSYLALLKKLKKTESGNLQNLQNPEQVGSVGFVGTQSGTLEKHRVDPSPANDDLVPLAIEARLQSLRKSKWFLAEDCQHVRSTYWNNPEEWHELLLMAERRAGLVRCVDCSHGRTPGFATHCYSDQRTDLPIAYGHRREAPENNADCKHFLHRTD